VRGRRAEGSKLPEFGEGRVQDPRKSRPGSDGNPKSPAGFRFMSTQKREGCWQRTTCPERAGSRVCFHPGRYARYGWAIASGRTAPLRAAFWLVWAWMATIFLQKDQPLRHSARPLFQAEPPGSPLLSPPRRFRASGKPASPRSYLPLSPVLPSLAESHLTLPRAPAQYRRAERYDGKGNLHLLYAA